MSNNKETGKGNSDYAHEGLGSVGICACAKCGYEKPHTAGKPCLEERCPECGSALLRKEGEHYKKAIKSQINST